MIIYVPFCGVALNVAAAVRTFGGVVKVMGAIFAFFTHDIHHLR